jgi:hypothetical protein
MPPHCFFGNAVSHINFVSHYYNFQNGLRKTTGNPNNYDNTLYMFGGSQILGSLVEDSHTLSSYLQSYYNIHNINVRVLNYGISGQPPCNSYLQFIQCDFKRDDIVCMFVYSTFLKSIYRKIDDIVQMLHEMRSMCIKKGVYFYVFVLPNVSDIEIPSEREQFLVEKMWQADKTLYSKCSEDLAATLYNNIGFHGKFLNDSIQRPHDMGEIFFDHFHWNHQANERMAEEIYTYITQQEINAISTPPPPPDTYSYIWSRRGKTLCGAVCSSSGTIPIHRQSRYEAMVGENA